MNRLDPAPAPRRLTFGLLGVLLAMCLLTAHAAAPAPGTPPAWEQLTPAQREQLIAPLRQRWNSQPQSRARMLQHAQRWQQLAPDQRRHAQRGIQRLERLTPQQRQELRALYQHMQQLPEAERRRLRERLKTMTPEQRRAWLQQQKQ